MNTYLGGDNIIRPVTHYDTSGKGGYRCVATLKERDLILEEQLSLGMKVFVQSENIEYQLSTLNPLAWIVSQGGVSTGAGIDDTLISKEKTWSSFKIDGSIITLKSALVDGAVSTLDTIGKLSKNVLANNVTLDEIYYALSNKAATGVSYTKQEADYLFQSKALAHNHLNLLTLESIQALPNNKSFVLTGDGYWRLLSSFSNQLDLIALLDGKSDINHNHDTRYLGIKEISNHLDEYDHRDLHSHNNKAMLDKITGQELLLYCGTWNATTGEITNTVPAKFREFPLLVSLPKAIRNSGIYFIVDTAGEYNPNDVDPHAIDGLIKWGVNDWIISTGEKWVKIGSETSGYTVAPALIAFSPEQGLIPNRETFRLFFNTGMDPTTINSTNIILRRVG